MSGGTEGVLSPHFTVFTRSFRPFSSSSEKGLVIGISHTKKFLPEEIGTTAQVLETTNAVNLAMQDAGLKNPDDIHLVQVKCPLLTNYKVNNSLIRGVKTVTNDTYKSMAYSRGASALGVAIALGDVKQNEIDNSTILSDFNKYSSCASISAGIEVDNNVVIVFGNLVGSSSSYFISHTIMYDSIDMKSVLEMFANEFGLNLLENYSVISDRLVNIFVKAEASPDGLIRGERHTMLTDSDITSTRHARAAMGGFLAALTGKTSLYVSGGAEHQGPSGGGTFAAITKRK
jgi:cyanuric acid amidohydrolase